MKVITVLLALVTLVVAQTQMVKRNFGAWHYECGKCHAMFTEVEGEKAKHKCPSDKTRLAKAVGDMKGAAFKCPKCAMRWSARSAKRMKMACPRCYGKLVPRKK